MCNHGFLEEDNEPQELLTMRRIRKFINKQFRETEQMLQDTQKEFLKENHIDSYSELPLDWAVDILERIGDEFSLSIKDFIRDLELEEEEAIMKTPTVSLESVKSFFSTTQFQVNHQVGKLGLDLVEDGRYPNGEIPVDWFTNFMTRIKGDFSKAVDDFVADMCAQAEKEKKKGSENA
jgi:hypothetical protein|nr:MAG TPA: hypothetical protein [Caudoviricetes sp.]